ncbi:energy-coupling factor transporter ATPase [Brevibacillus sp. SYSU BS000544]|uniref:energy-coupling factor transporter ATPase n=1 Tax=Brevibacillus sp. SYSU BS000544 TaxID=3416443 RepID=UPI003CE474FA
MKQEMAVEAIGVSFLYEEDRTGRGKVLDQINLSIQQGTFVSIIGHNGSGKSTLAKLMNALLLPSDGTIIVSGFDTRDEQVLWEVRRQIGMVFQNPDNQIVGVTVEDDVAFGLENLGVAPDEMPNRIKHALESVQMDQFADRQPHHLSGGQKQRIAIAGIIAMRPSVIVLDEATAMLDPRGKQEVMSLAHRLHQEHGITILHITHFPEETLQSDRVIVMNEGKVYLDGTPRTVYEDVDRLLAIGLDVPLAVRLRHQLKKQGIAMNPVFHREELVSELCKLLSKT